MQNASSWCGVKAACRGLGIQAPTLPFDWMRLSLGAVMKALASGFEDFLKYEEVAHHSFATPTHEVF